MTKFQINLSEMFSFIKVLIAEEAFTLQICFSPKKCDGESENRKPVEFWEDILLEGKNRSKVVQFTIEPLSSEGPDMVIFVNTFCK